MDNSTGYFSERSMKDKGLSNAALMGLKKVGKCLNLFGRH